MATYDLSALGPEPFENIVNFLALKVLGAGATGFGPGSDGGRDGYFEGEAPYPSAIDHWKGVWYIQSKFHRPHLTKNSQKWLLEQVNEEIKLFESKDSNRIWPNNWIIATNIDPSGKPETGSFDAIKKLLKKTAGGRKVNLAIWGGRKILDLLSQYSDIAKYYGHFLTPGHVISELYEGMADEKASISEIVRYLVVTQFSEYVYTKLDQAGSMSDSRPGVHDLFIDLPISVGKGRNQGRMLRELCSTSAQCHRYSLRKNFPDNWRIWQQQSLRARAVLIKGGPGQGKSTVGQYLCQIQRAALILADDEIRVSDALAGSAAAIRTAAQRDEFWPRVARIPIQIELKDYAQWFSQLPAGHPAGVLAFLAYKVAKSVGSDVRVKTLKRALSARSWLLVFDGLDEVPNDFKDAISAEVLALLNDSVIDVDADVLAICTSRPQGYSGQFSALEGPTVNLVQLDPDIALECAKPLLKFDRSEADSKRSIETLTSAMHSASVQELMTTPLQSHIMAVVVRDGGRPPERRWALFNSFYLVMKKRESLKDFQNPKIAKLLREEDRLLRSVHTRLGFVLHARAETSEGAQTTLSRAEFQELVQSVVAELGDDDVAATVTSVMEATTERLVLVSTPESGEHVRFDIRQLQEFFACEFLYDGISPEELARRVEVIGGDSHWREVMHFLLSALVENRRTTELAVAVQELRLLNEGDPISAEGIYFRRVAPAAMLAMRLVLEGVVEQDQRDRHQIRPLIDAIAGLADIDASQPLAFLSLSRSLQWLIQILLARVQMSNPREYLGALYLLGWLLPSGHTSTADVRRSFANSPMEVKSQAIQSWARFFAGQRFHLAKGAERPHSLSAWVIDELIGLLGTDDWLACDATTIRDVLAILRTDQTLTAERLRGFGLTKKVADAILLSIGEIDRHRGAATGADVSLGLVAGKLYPANWMNRTKAPSFSEVSIRSVVRQTSGYFRLLLAVAWFAEEITDDSLDDLRVQLAVAGSDRLGAVPGSLLALIPIENSHAVKPYGFDHLMGGTSAEIQTQMKEWARRRRFCIYEELRILRPNRNSDEMWVALAEGLPRIALRFVFSPRYLKDVGGEDAQPIHFVPQVCALFEQLPDYAGQFVLQWGYLEKANPELLRKLKGNARAMSCSEEAWIDLESDVAPFKVDLPQDAALLPLLARSVAYLASNEEGYLHRDAKERRLSPSEVIDAFGLQATTLRHIANSESIEKEVRAGAAALFWMKNRESPKLAIERLPIEDEMALFDQLVTDTNQVWMVQSLLRGVLQQYSDAEPPAVAAAGNLLERFSDSRSCRTRLVDLTRQWRERSNSPVQAKQVMQKWLDYSFTES
jgi:hypothetical protein